MLYSSSRYKWTSLEGLTQSVYTIESDVWSYAIVLSEICSLGDNPYVQHRTLSAGVSFVPPGNASATRAHPLDVDVPRWLVSCFDMSSFLFW